MNYPKVTVAIPTYNRLSLLKRCLESVIEQDYPNIEIIVSDNSSNDGTALYLESQHISNLVVNINVDNLGMVGNWDKCLSLASGDLFILLSDDDYFTDKDSVTNFVDGYLSNENIGIVISTVAIEENGILTKFGRTYTQKLFLMPDLVSSFFLNEIYVFPCATMLKTRDIKKQGGYGSFHAQLAVDACMWIKLSCSYKNALYIDRDLVVYKNHASLTSSSVETWENDFNELDRVLDLASCRWAHKDIKKVKRSLAAASNRIPIGYIVKKIKFDNSYKFTGLVKDVFKYRKRIFKFSNLVFSINRMVFKAGVKIRYFALNYQLKL